jgi:TatA/E family protein of Tat protein translocase
MGPLGVPELIFILVIALLIFGPKRLPEFGRTIGKAMGEFRRASSDLKRSIDVELSAADERRPPAAAAQAPAPAVARERPEPTTPSVSEETEAASEEAAGEEPEGEATEADESEDGSVN